MVLKLDMSKAYDHVEQCFLEKLMRRMRFYSRWIDLIMECVRTVSYSILVNREPRGMINPSKGIRQGDPLSPFLFLLCTEGMHWLIMQATRAKQINGFSPCKRGPKLTPQPPFSGANSQECGNVLKTLSDYEVSSKKKINREKMTLFFSKSTQ